MTRENCSGTGQQYEKQQNSPEGRSQCSCRSRSTGPRSLRSAPASPTAELRRLPDGGSRPGSGGCGRPGRTAPEPTGRLCRRSSRVRWTRRTRRSCSPNLPGRTETRFRRRIRLRHRRIPNSAGVRRFRPERIQLLELLDRWNDLGVGIDRSRGPDRLTRQRGWLGVRNLGLLNHLPGGAERIG